MDSDATTLGVDERTTLLQQLEVVRHELAACSDCWQEAVRRLEQHGTALPHKGIHEPTRLRAVTQKYTKQYRARTHVNLKCTKNTDQCPG